MKHTKVKFDKVPQILREISKISGSYVSVGVHESARPYEDKSSVQMVATVQEYGSTNTPHPIPERSYMRSTEEESRSEMNDKMKSDLPLIALGQKTVKKSLSEVGFVMKERVKSKIEQISSPRNAESTVKAKGFNNPLIDTRHLKNSIDYEVHV